MAILGWRLLWRACYVEQPQSRSQAAARRSCQWIGTLQETSWAEHLLSSRSSKYSEEPASFASSQKPVCGTRKQVTVHSDDEDGLRGPGALPLQRFSNQKCDFYS